MKKWCIALIATIVMLNGCSIWKTTTLKPKRFAFVKTGAKAGEVAVKIDEFGLEDLSIGIGIYNGMICLADNELKRIQVMKANGDVELIIGSIKNLKTQNIPAKNFNFGIIGYFAMDDDNNIYVQNKFTSIRQGRPTEKDIVANSIDFSPSYILVFNKNGELQHTLGQKGTPDIPFQHIEKIFVDSQGRLFVTSRSADSWSIFRFTGKRRNYFANLNTNDFKDKNPEEKNTYEGKIDNVIILKNGEKALISVSYYHGLRLKYIKIYEYDLEKNKNERTILEIPDPQNVLFDIIDDKYIYLWNVRRDDIRFEVSNLNGAIINNVYMKLKYKRNYYTKIFLDEAGRFYTFNIMRSGVDIMRWE